MNSISFWLLVLLFLQIIILHVQKKIHKKIIQHTLPQVAVMVTCNQAFVGGGGGGGQSDRQKEKKNSSCLRKKRGRITTWSQITGMDNLKTKMHFTLK